MSSLYTNQINKITASITLCIIKIEVNAWLMSLYLNLYVALLISFHLILCICSVTFSLTKNSDQLWYISINLTHLHLHFTNGLIYFLYILTYFNIVLGPVIQNMDVDGHSSSKTTTSHMQAVSLISQKENINLDFKIVLDLWSPY